MTAQVLAVSSKEARQIAVTSQLLSDAGTAASPQDVLRHLGAIQLDAMQRVDKSHRLVCFSRLADFQGREAVDRYFWTSEGPAFAFETWAHAVSLVPVEDWPLWGFRRSVTRSVSWAPPAPACDRLIDMIRDSGPQTIRELEARDTKTSGWDWSDTKKAAEYLVWTGGLVCCARSGPRRVYDLPERRIPAALLGLEVAADDAIAGLVAKAAKACGIATAADLASYFQLPRPVVAAAAEKAGLIRAEVEGWPEAAWVHPAALREPLLGSSPVFLSPFDSLIWDRARTRRVFGFDYTLEAYKPAAKRVYGYYVMPLLSNGEMLGRADIAREGGVLRVLRFHPETDNFDSSDMTIAANKLAVQLGCGAAEI